ncbi:MAG: hypothetical protein FJX25_10590 [Alphaproteobacteria bacterium]|nr:hypothetical protein [Alphaproteobacteria bacterium]
MNNTPPAQAQNAAVLCLEARQLRLLCQDLHRNRLRLLNDLWNICTQGQERRALACHDRMLRKERDA